MPSSTRGISLAILSMFFFSIVYAFYKACAPYLPNTLIIFFQGLCSWLLISPFILKKEIHGLYSSKWFLIILRTLAGLLGIYCIAEALETISLAETNLFNNTAPLFVPFLIWIWHRTKIPKKLWLGIIIGFIGIFIIFRPGFGSVDLGIFFALFSGVFTAILLVITKEIAHEPFIRILFYYYLIFWVALFPFLFTQWSNPPLFVWLFLILAGISNILAQISFTIAMRHAPSHEIAPFIYTGVIFSGMIDWIFWHNKPDLISIVGMGVVCVGGAMTLIFSRKKIES